MNRRTFLGLFFLNKVGILQ
uniref:Uncharacterized protein n=1 Tax=Anguilla anguilla TaxID=7936 RepID=A0A0E9WE61_ANGAN